MNELAIGKHDPSKTHGQNSCVTCHATNYTRLHDHRAPVDIFEIRFGGIVINVCRDCLKSLSTLGGQILEKI